MKTKIDFSEERDFFANVTKKVAEKIRNYMTTKGVKSICCIDSEKDAIYGIDFDADGLPRDFLILGFHINKFGALEIVFVPNDIEVDMVREVETKSLEMLIDSETEIIREPLIGGEFMDMPTIENIVNGLEDYLE